MKSSRILFGALFLFFLVGVNNKVIAQDPIFTQFYSNPIYLNPAFAGSRVCPRFALNYRNEWPNISGNFITTAAAYDQKPEIAEAMAMAANRVLAESWLAEKVRSEITETAIQSAYDKFVADTASREQVTASHILVETETEATALITALQQGADFAELAKEKSTGPSGPNGGALGTFGRGQMVPAFETAAFNLAAGSVSDTPVQTQFGWHVIKVESKEIAPAPDLQDMRAQLANNLSTQTLSRILEELRARQDIQLRRFAEIRTDAMNAAQ